MSRPEAPEGARAVLLALVLGVLVVWFGLDRAGFISLAQFAEILRRTTELALPALAMTALLLGGAIDLSLAGTMALAAAVINVAVRHPPIAWWLGPVLAVAAGALAGGVNAVLVGRLRLSPVLVTLGTGWLFRGLAEGLAHGRARGGVAMPLLQLGQGYVLADRLPAQVLLLAVVALGYHLLLERTRAGRALRATGSTGGGARTRAWLYVLGGATAALASIAQVARTAEAAPAASTGMEALALVAAVLGGASLAGGRGSVSGALLASALVTTAATAATMVPLPTHAATMALAVAALGTAAARSRPAAARTGPGKTA